MGWLRSAALSSRWKHFSSISVFERNMPSNAPSSRLMCRRPAASTVLPSFIDGVEPRLLLGDEVVDLFQPRLTDRPRPVETAARAASTYFVPFAVGGVGGNNSRCAPCVAGATATHGLVSLAG